MSYYLNDEGYQPSFYDSDNEDMPMTQQEPYEQPQMSNLERLLREALEYTRRVHRELDEEFDWNFEPYHEEPYDTLSSANERLDDVEAIEHKDYYSNDDFAGSSNFVFQDDSEDEMVEEEENHDYTNYPQETSQVVLQESNDFEPELKECAEFEDSDFEDSDEELEIGEEIVEIPVTPILETVSVLCDSNELIEELENEVVIIENKLEETPMKPQIIKQVDELENQVTQRLEILDSDAELYALLGLDNGELQEFVDNGDGAMTEAELLEMMEPKVENPLEEELEGTMLLSKSSPQVPLTDFASYELSCEHDFVLTKDPKPPDPFLPDLKDLLVVKDVNEPNFDMDEDMSRKRELSKDLKFHTSLVNYSLLVGHGEVEANGGMFVVEKVGKCTLNECTVVWMRNIPQGGHSMGIVVILEKYYSNRKEQENFLQVEYDWKGLKVLVDYPP